MALGGLVLGFHGLYLKGMRTMMFQLSGFYSRYFRAFFIKGCKVCSEYVFAVDLY